MEIIKTQDGILAIHCGIYDQKIYFKHEQDGLYYLQLHHTRMAKRPGWSEDKVMHYLSKCWG